MVDATQVPAGWTGSTTSCAVGTESSGSIGATLLAVNTLRDFAGLPPVGFDAELNRKALSAAVMMRAAGALSHSPGPDWPCYTADGDEGAGRSNLYLGQSGAGAMVGYVDDGGVDSLGHRRWLLDPRGVTFGTGSTGSTNALLVIGGGGTPAAPPELVSWPPAGFVPWPLVFDTWSIAITQAGAVDTSGATVSVTVDGQSRATSNVRTLADGFGTGRTVAWESALTDADRAGVRQVTATLSNVVIGGVSRSFTVAFEGFPAFPPAAPAFTAQRTADAVSVSWQAAAERGVPVTGYRILGEDSGGIAFDKTVGGDVRQTNIPYVRPDRVVNVRVIPLSRAGSPEVAALAVSPPRASGEGAGPTIDGGGGLRDVGPLGGEEPSSGAGSRIPARLRVTQIRLRGRQLLVRARLARRASGKRLRVMVRAGRRTRSVTRTIREGRAGFSIRLAPFYLRHRPLRVTIRFAGSGAVRPASARFTFR